MVERDKIEGLIRHLRQYTTHLQEITDQDRDEFLRDPGSIGSARYYLQVSIETCINIANHPSRPTGSAHPRTIRTHSRYLGRPGFCRVMSPERCENWPGSVTFWCTCTGM